jgi:hypothetical protein
MDRAAPDARATDSGLAHFSRRRLPGEHALERPQLAVGLCRLGDLDADQVTTPDLKSMQLEHEATQVAKLNLSQVVKEARTPAQPCTLA